MLWILDRRVGGLDLSRSAVTVMKMLIATAVMWLACVGVQRLPFYPSGQGKLIWACQLALLIFVGVSTYFGTCFALGMDVMKHIRRRRGQQI
jgi:peptidoglycan biosynthesis protein MviN/MurJ (putative lipid II flippase)